MEQITKEETIKHLKEMLRQKNDLIENMENEIKKLKNKTEKCDACGKDFQCGTESPYHKIVQCVFCGNLQTRSAAKNEPAPTGTGKKVIDEVVLDIKARSDMVEKKYGTPLRTFNGRNAMMDLYQELLDSVMYAKQVLMEMEDK